jgi:hypothetical protein
MALRALLFLASSLLAVQCRSVQELYSQSFTLSLPKATEGKPDCTCLERTEELNGGIIEGMYSYVDPVGSLIQVSYSMNPDKSNYVEERKVLKNYLNSGSVKAGSLTIEQVVERVLNELTPTVIEVVRTTVQGSSDFDLSTAAAKRELVQTIIVRLRPVVFEVVTQVLRETSTTYLDAEELTDLIVLRLTPVVERGVSEESAKVNLAQIQAQKEDLVTQISLELKPTIVRIIQATVASSDLSDLSGLLRAILTQLRPVVLREVESALAASSLNLNANELSDEIMAKITPFIQDALDSEVKKATRNTEDEVVQLIIKDLKPTVIRIISATVSSSQVDLTNLDGLLRTILAQLRPVVLNEVKTALVSSSLSGYIDANSLTNRIMQEITPFVRQALEAEVQKVQANALTEDQVVQLIITDLRPTILRIIQATVSSSSVDLSNTEGLLKTILVQLRPVVLQEVRSALSQSQVAGNINANSLTDRIILEMTPFVRQALQSEVQKVQQQSETTETLVVDEVKTQLKPTVLKVIQSTVAASGIDLSSPQGLVEAIIAQLRPVVFQAVSVALKSSPYTLDAEKLTVRIIIELKPFIETGVQKEVETVQAERDDSGLIQSIVDRLRPAIISTVQGLEGNNVISEGMMSQILTVIPDKMKPVIRQKVKTLMTTDPSATALPDSVLADRIAADLQGDIIGAIEADNRFRVVTKMKGFSTLMQRILSILRPFILQEIQAYKTSIQKVVPEPAPTGGLSSIFGISGQNFVKVDTPAFNYGYETRK